LTTSDTSRDPGSHGLPAVRRGVPRYAVAVGATAAAVALSVLLAPYLTRVVFILFWPAVLGTAVVAGLGPALLASTLAVLAVQYLFIPPLHTLKSGDPVDLAPLAIFFLASGLVSTLADRRRTAEARMLEAARSNASLASQLARQTVELETQLEESQAMSEELEATGAELHERTQEAEASAAFARGILESISEPFVVQDAEWRFRYINSAAGRVFAQSGHDPDALIGRVVWDVYPALARTAFEREMRRAAAERVAAQFEAFYAERGTWSQMNCYPLADGGLATQWTDITPRKRAEEALHYLDRATELLTDPLEPEKRLTDLADLVVPRLADWCTIDLVDDDGRSTQVAVAHVDPAKVKWARELTRRYPPRIDAPTGVPQVLRTGRPVLYPEITDDMLVAGAIDHEHLRISRELGLRSAMIVPLSIGEQTIGALTLVSAESRRRYTQEDLALVGELARRAALALDNARQHQKAIAAQHEAESANRAKSDFLAAMSHELRTPLNAIAGYVDLMLLGLRGTLSAAQQTDLERVQTAQRHLLHLITDILNFARIEATGVEFDLRVVPLSALLAELRTFVNPQLEGRTLQFNCETPPADAMVRADPTKVRQILLNLLSNSVKFTRPGGRIDVRCEREGPYHLIRVTDTGVGIAPENLERVFEPFVQTHRSLTEPTGGVGLGLAISRDLARAMDGELTVASEEEVGSTFTLALPAA
jgi:PAS domain S-box-containing protein